MAVVTPLNNPGGPEGDTVTVDEQLLNTEYCAGGGHRATARAPTQSAAYACGVGSSGRVDANECASGAGPAAAGAAAGRERMG